MLEIGLKLSTYNTYVRTYLLDIISEQMNFTI